MDCNTSAWLVNPLESKLSIELSSLRFFVLDAIGSLSALCAAFLELLNSSGVFSSFIAKGHALAEKAGASHPCFY